MDAPKKPEMNPKNESKNELAPIEDQPRKKGFWSRMRGLVSRKKNGKDDPTDDLRAVDATIKSDQKAPAPKPTSTKKADPRAPKRPKVVARRKSSGGMFVPPPAGPPAGTMPRLAAPIGTPRPVGVVGPDGERLVARIETRVETALTEALGKKDVAMTRLTDGFAELTGILEKIGTGLEDQGVINRRIMEQLQELPEALKAFPEASGRETEILETIQREIHAQSAWGQEMVSALGDLPRLVEVVQNGSPTDKAQLAVMRGLNKQVESQSRQRAELIKSVELMRGGIDEMVVEMRGQREARAQVAGAIERLDRGFETLERRGLETHALLRAVARGGEANRASVDRVARTVARSSAEAQHKTVDALERIEREREERWREGFFRIARPSGVVALAVALVGAIFLFNWMNRPAGPSMMDIYDAASTARTDAREARERAEASEGRFAELLAAIGKLGEKQAAAPASTPTPSAPAPASAPETPTESSKEIESIEPDEGATEPADSAPASDPVEKAGPEHASTTETETPDEVETALAE